MKKFIELKLRYWAKLILKKYQPAVIAITGSVGKTSTKEAIYSILKKEKRVRQSEKNYNNEIGLPLTIIGSYSPGKNIFGWIIIGFKVLWLLIVEDKNYPEILILEMGIDKPGDMDYLTEIAKPIIGVATLVGSVHLEHFKNREALQAEKGKLISSIEKAGYAIINFDDEGTKKMAEKSEARVISFGLSENSVVSARNIHFNYDKENKLKGVGYELKYLGARHRVELPNVIGLGAVYSSLAAICVGIIYNVNLDKVCEYLRDYKSPVGRLNVVEGIKHTSIIDDTYNSEPKSALLAVSALKIAKIDEGAKKYAVLGDMLELGPVSVDSHRQVGEYVAKSKIDKLVVVGERAKDIARSAKENGMREEDVFAFDKSEEAGKFLQNRIKQNDLMLVKGSQGMRMEKIVLELMAEPLRAEELLVRQDKQWRGR